MFSIRKGIISEDIPRSVPSAVESGYPAYKETSRASGEVQRSREYFRIDADVRLRSWPLGGEDLATEEESRRVTISGGGIRFVSEDDLWVGQQLGLEIILPGDNPRSVRCVGEVVWREDARGGRCEAALGFSEISPRDRDRVIGFCLAEQRRLLRTKVRVD